ncbi:hypothetical protein ACWCXX_16995 [Streptomyces sp. NPDC001732]
MNRRDAGARVAESPRIGLVLRVPVFGNESAGPGHHAPVVAEKADKGGNSNGAGDSSGTGGAGWTGIAAAVGAGAAVVVIVGFVLLRGRRGRAARTTRGSA